ncbi:MAG TPA: TSUP family transporter, partial [Pseudoduganella sp.]
LVVVPALVGFFNVAQARAQGMALALVVPGTLVALSTYAGEGQVDWWVGIPLAIGGVLSVSTGVMLAHRFPARSLRLLFCLVLLVTAGLMFAARH